MPSANTKPPITAVRRVDFLRHKAIIIGAANIDTAQLAAPNHPVFISEGKKGDKKIKWEARNRKIILTETIILGNENE